MGTLIHLDQAGFMKGRLGVDNVRRLHHIPYHFIFKALIKITMRLTKVMYTTLENAHMPKLKSKTHKTITDKIMSPSKQYVRKKGLGPSSRSDNQLDF